MTRQSDKLDLRVAAQKLSPGRIRKEELGQTAAWFEEKLHLSEDKALLCARFCVRHAVGPPSLWRLLRDLER